MALFLVQHGKSLSKEIDPTRGLTEEGIRDVKMIAGIARGYSVKPKCIKHSGKKRAFQTAEILGEILVPDKGVLEINGINPMDDVISVAEEVISNDHVMLVGHLPFMEKMTSYLVAGVEDITVFKFQNGGIVCLDQLPLPYGWLIKWALMPNIS